MTTISQSPEITLLQRCFEALSQGDFAPLEQALSNDAIWRSIWEGSTNCHGREEIVGVMSRNLAGRVRGSIEEMTQHGERVLVGFRPAHPTDRPLEEGIAYMVVTIAGAEITELKGCPDRASALNYIQTGELPAPVARTCHPAEGESEPTGVREPENVAEPPAQRVSGLIPFVAVTDMRRSIAFYHHLGFTAKSIYEWRGRLSWAALESEGAEIMLHGSDSVDADAQGVLFYLYSNDLVALREQLLAAGTQAGEIEDGSPGPREEMRVTDPDGYVLMIAQND
jgi:catechol 2,3-dioxygenase-like lactoylglutathione lyase family enzyme/ketosteroid isomerase-like protein